jgi:hypothetical protein
MGPWLHSSVDMADQGELNFPNAVNVAREAAFAFFDYYLHGAKNGWPLTPEIRYYQMGENEWRSCADWAAMGNNTHFLYFSDEGALLPVVESGNIDADNFAADPRDPSPSHGGARFNPFDAAVIPGPLDIRDAVESRGDVLLYTSGDLAENLVVCGGAKVRLFIHSDQPDTDFSIRLCDVFPDGRSMILTDGIARARFREGADHEAPPLTDSIYQLDVILQEMAHTFLKGHRVRVVVGGADYPRFDVNLNNGGLMYAEGDSLIAHNQVYHTPAFPSSLELETARTSGMSPMVPESTGLRLAPPWPQPFSQSGVLRIMFESSPQQTVRVDVRDLVGRRLRTVYDGPGKDHAVLVWNGDDAAGRPLTTGVYLLTLSTQTEAQSQLLSIIR